MNVPAVFQPLWRETQGGNPARLLGLRGGRGSGKSWAVAQNRVLYQYHNPNSSGVCLREVQRSIKYSSKKLIEDVIRMLGLSDEFIITQHEIRMKNGDGVIIFQGLMDHTADSIKSLEGFDWAFVEEAQTITKHSLDLLIPTIRKENSVILLSWNPRNADDPVETLFSEREDKMIITSTYLDNSFCPQAIKDEAEQMKKVNYEDYLHIFMGEYQQHSDAQIFKDKFEVVDFKIDESREVYYGLDFGFSVDPSAITASYVKDNCLYIFKENGRVGVEIVDTYLLLDAVINSKNDLVYADSARPEIISHLKNLGYNVVSVKKWKGSIEDGISTIRSFEKVYIHTSCDETAKEFTKYSYKTDRVGNITSNIEDKYNHYIDSLRYAMSDLITREDNAYDVAPFII